MRLSINPLKKIIFNIPVIRKKKSSKALLNIYLTFLNETAATTPFFALPISREPLQARLF